MPGSSLVAKIHTADARTAASRAILDVRRVGRRGDVPVLEPYGASSRPGRSVFDLLAIAPSATLTGRRSFMSIWWALPRSRPVWRAALAGRPGSVSVRTPGAWICRAPPSRGRLESGQAPGILHEPTRGFEPLTPSLRGRRGVSGWLRSMPLSAQVKPISAVSPPSVLRLALGGVLPRRCQPGLPSGSGTLCRPCRSRKAGAGASRLTAGPDDDPDRCPSFRGSPYCSRGSPAVGPAADCR